MTTPLSLDSLLTPSGTASQPTTFQRKLRESTPTPGKERSAIAQWVRDFSGMETEDRFCGMLVRSAQDIMVVCDSSLNILYHNRAFLKTFGHREGTYENFSLLDFIPSDDRHDAGNAFSQLEHGSATAMKIDANLLTKDPEPIRVSGRVTRTRRRDHEVFFYLVLRPVEAPIRQVVEKVIEKPSPLVLDHLPLMMWETDASLRITGAFGRLWRDYFLQPESAVGSQLGDSTCEQTPEFLRYVDFTDLQKGQPVGAFIEWNGETLDLSIRPVFDANQQMIGTVGFIKVPDKIDNPDDVENFIVTRKVVSPRPIADRSFRSSDEVAMAS